MMRPHSRNSEGIFLCKTFSIDAIGHPVGSTGPFANNFKGARTSAPLELLLKEIRPCL